MYIVFAGLLIENMAIACLVQYNCDMEMITIQTRVSAPIETVWDCWTNLEHINDWAFASEDWGAEAKLNELRVDGKFSTYMAPRDGSQGFDFSGHYTAVDEYRYLAYVLDDGRTVTVDFQPVDGDIQITQTFEPEDENDPEFQRQGWQAYLDNFKAHVESH